MKLNAATRLLAEENVIAPSDSYKHENENELRHQQTEHQHDQKQQQRENEQNKPEPSTEASTTPEAIDPLTDTAAPQFAVRAHFRLLADRLNTESDPLTDAEEDACMASDTVDESSLPGATGYNMVGEEGNTNYMNVEGETLADADPRLFDVANQPLG